MPYREHQKAFRTEFIGASLICAVLAIGIVKFDVFDRWYEYTRAHEDWEIDEIFAIFIAILAAGTILAMRHYFIMRSLAKELAEANAQIKQHGAREAQGEKLTALGHLSAGLAHEVNNALQPTTGLGEFVLKELRAKKCQKHVEYMEIILNSTRHAQQIIQNVLFFSQNKDSELIDHFALSVLLNAIEFAQSMMPSQIIFESTFEREDELGQITIHCNETELAQIFINLFKNAAAAMNEKGTITINIAKGIMPHTKDDPCVQITVTDTGHGMDQETQNQIFNPFFSTKDPSEGTGLGLSAVHGFIAHHGGDIDVESAPGTGTTFRIYLPTKQTEKAN